jgi:hypothetical protein
MAKSTKKIDSDFEAAAAQSLADENVDKPIIPIKITPASTVISKNKWPLQKDAVAFYGDPFKPDFMSNLTSIQCPWKFQAGTSKIICHKKVADSLIRVLNKTWNDINHSQDTAHILGYDVFDGSYVVRNKRGGTTPSMHSFGIAFDFDAAANQQHSMKHLFQHNTPLVDNFIAEGWIWGGDWSPGSIDAMHFQAARVHA